MAASKRKVSQNDLRKMMADIKSGEASKTASKRLKLSSRELALIEEEKRQKALRDQEKLRLKQEKLNRVMPNKDLQPKKSILKNSSSTTFFVPTTPQFQAKVQKEVEEKSSVSFKEKEEISRQEEPESGAIPEGFFDDPKLDAKARNVQFVDQGEEEWAKFQKEISDEMSAAQDILVEDRNEATADRQIEEIEEQIEAWKRVAQLEEKKESVTKIIKEKAAIFQHKHILEDTNEDSDASEEELDELTDWRKKC